MKIEKTIYTFFILTVLILGWKVNDYFNPNFEKKLDQNISKLNDKRKELNELVDLATLEILEKDIPNKSMDLDDMSDKLREEMEVLGFQSFSFESSKKCNEKLRISFLAWEDWNTDNLNHVEIIYSPCDSETKKGFHSFDGSHLDVIGAGDDWKIVSDTDFI